MAPSKSTCFLCGQIFSTLYCTHNKQYSGNCSLPLAKLATRNEWILEVDFLFSRIKDFPRSMSNISYCHMPNPTQIWSNLFLDIS